MACRTITSGEDPPRNDESGRIGTEILEEVGQAVQEHKGLLGRRSRGKLVVSET